MLVPIAAAAVALPAAIVGLVVWGQKRQRDRLEHFRAVAAHLGLTLTGERSAHRLRAGVTASVLLTSESRGSGKSRHTVSVTRYAATPPAPLRMHLRVTPQSAFFGDIADALGMVEDVIVGDPHFDPLFRVAAAEKDHAAAVLAGEPARALVMARRAGNVRVDDHTVRAQHDGWDLDAGVIAANLDALETAARALFESRTRNVAVWERSCAASWGSVAAGEQLIFDARSTCLHGTLEGARVWIAADTAHGKWVTKIVARFAEPLEVGLEIYPARFLQSVSRFFGAQDVEVGHAAFDEAFMVKAQHPETAQQIVGPEIAAALVELLGRALDVRVDDQGVTATVEGVVMDPRALTALVREVVTVVTLRRRPASAGAFR